MRLKSRCRQGWRFGQGWDSSLIQVESPFSSLCFLHQGIGLFAKSCPTLATLWTVARQPPLSMEFSRQEYWSRLPFLSLGDLPHPGIEPRSPALQADSLPLSQQGSLNLTYLILKSSAASLALSTWMISLAFSALLHRI